MSSREWINIDNQSPIIKGINDDPVAALRILQRELKRNKIENHNFYCGRDIVGHKAFNVPIEEAWRILNESHKQLSGSRNTRPAVDNALSKAKRKLWPSPTNRWVCPGGENGVVIFKQYRSAGAAENRGKIAIVGRNPEAIWFTGYEDRVLFDEAGLFPKKESERNY